MPHGEAQGFGDPETGLEEHQDQEGVPVPVAPPAAPLTAAGPRQASGRGPGAGPGPVNRSSWAAWQ